MKTEISKMLYPTESMAPGQMVEEPKSNKRSKAQVPVKDNDFGQLCTTVSAKWKANPAFTLLYITQGEFDLLANNYNSDLGSKQKTVAYRPGLTQELAQADKTINKAIGQVKTYLKEKYENQAVAYYAAFGIERSGKAYIFPIDRNKRKNALAVLTAAINQEGFAEKKYGAKFWDEMGKQYSLLLEQASKTDGEHSNKVGNKNMLKQTLKKVLNSLIFLIKANYPDNYTSELRNWGFQKDKY